MNFSKVHPLSFDFPIKEVDLSCKLKCLREIVILMSISDGLGPSFFCRKIEKTRAMRKEVGGKVIISQQS